VAVPFLYRVGRAQGLATLVEQFGGERIGSWFAVWGCAADRMLGQQLLGLLPQFAIDDWLVLTRVASLEMRISPL